MKRSRESFDAEEGNEVASVVGEPSSTVVPAAASSGTVAAASGEVTPVEEALRDVSSEIDRKKTKSGDGEDGPSHAAVPSDIEAAYKEIDESYDQSAEYTMWGAISAKLTNAPTAAPPAAPTVAPTEEPRVEEESSDGGLALSDGHGSGDGGSGEDDEDVEEVPPTSPNVDEKSACNVHVSNLVILQLKEQKGVHTDFVLQAVVKPNQRPSSFMVSRVLLSKLGTTNWRIVQSHEEGDSAYLYIKMRRQDVLRCHGKRYEWEGEQVTFRKVNRLIPLIPDPMEAGPVHKIF